MSSHRLNNVASGTSCGRTGGRIHPKREHFACIVVDHDGILDPNPLLVFVLFVSLDNLVQRYEEPSSMVRWDSPLFTVPWTDPDVPADDIWRAITQGLVKPPNTGTQAVRVTPIHPAPRRLTRSVIVA